MGPSRRVMSLPVVWLMWLAVASKHTRVTLAFLPAVPSMHLPVVNNAFFTHDIASLSQLSATPVAPRRGGGKHVKSQAQKSGQRRQQQQQQPAYSNNDTNNRRNKKEDDIDDPFGDHDDDYYGHSNVESLNTIQYDPSGWDDDEDDDGDDVLLGRERKVKPEREVPVSHFFSKKPLSDPNFSADPTATATTASDDDNDGKTKSTSETFERLCDGVGISRPSRIQSLAWPVLMSGKSAIVADQTGSGKTLSYLIPLMQRMISQKRRVGQIHNNNPNNNNAAYANNNNGSPKILVLAPTAELADQIKTVCDKLSQHVPFRTTVITATGTHATSIRDQIRMLQNTPVDILVSTPGRIATILRSKQSGGLDLTQLQALVLDEVDVLLIDDTFGPQLRTVGVAAPVETTQFVFVTATLPDSVVETVQREFPNVQEIRGPGLHRVAATVKEHLVDVSIPSANNRNEDMCFEMKAKQLLKALRQHRCERTLVFCNTVESCRAVENLLKRADRKGQLRHVGAYHNAMNPEARNRNLDTFAHGKPKFNENQNPKEGSNSSSGRQRRQQQQYQDTVDVNQILVCTDRAARGVDFDAAPVNHVILFDFPKDPAEYVRRVGRTARAGRNGVSTVFAYGWQLPIARKIMGSKLDSFSIAANDTDDDESSEEYKGGVQGRKDQGHRSGGKRGPQNRDKDKMIKGNIEGGKLWKGNRQ